MKHVGLVESKRSSPLEWLIVLGIIAALITVLYPAVQAARHAKGPHGEMIPKDAPSESNRISHATGLSIVAPKNWDQVRDRGADEPFFCIAARGFPGARLKSIITIRKVESPSESDLRQFDRRMFRGLPAFEQLKIQRQSSFDDPASSLYTLYIEAEGEWWLVDWLVADAVQKLPPRIKEYLDTIKLPRIRNG